MIRLYLRPAFNIQLLTCQRFGLRLLHALPKMIADETAYLDIFSQAGDRFLNQIPDLFIGIFDEGLFEQTNFGIESPHFSGNDLVDDFLRFFSVAGLAVIDFAFPFISSSGTSSFARYLGFAAAICIATSLTRA